MTGGATDEALLRAWQAGDAAAGNALFERYFDALYRFFVHKHVDGDVMDLLQKTLLASVESLDRFEGHSSVRTYLYAIARNKLRDYWRERARNDGIDFGVSSLLDLGPSPSSLLRANEEQRLLFEALRRLPLDQQIAVELHYWDGLSGPQLAEVFGARAVIAPHRHSAPETGALAKTASGALERQPYLRVQNLADAMEALKDMGYALVGLAGEAGELIEHFQWLTPEQSAPMIATTPSVVTRRSAAAVAAAASMQVESARTGDSITP